MRTLFLAAAILPIFLWALGIFAVVVLGSTLADFIADSMIGCANRFRPVRRHHALF